MKNAKFFLFIILLGAVLVRLYRFDNPIADWHSWRQADTSAVSRNFVKNGIDVLHPTFDDLSNVPSGIDNPKGYRFVEFPIYNLKTAILFKIFGIFNIEQWGRLVSILASVLSALLLYLIVGRHSNKSIGLMSAFFFSFIPYNIYYGRTILPDPSMVAAILAGTLFFDLWLGTKSKKWLFFVLSILFTASAFLLKPYALFFTLPMITLAFNKFGFGILKKWQLWIFAALSVVPLILWRNWIMQFPEGVPANQWLLNGNGIRFRPAFFRWIFYERLIKLIAGYGGFLILVTGVLKIRAFKEWIFLSSFLVSSLIYVTVFATGNVQHDYYQILIMPSVAIFMAIGSYFLYKQGLVGKLILLTSLIGLFWFGWAQVKDYFNINNRSIIVAGEAVDQLTPKDAKVIAIYGGDTSFLYQTQRQGWASQEKGFPEMIQMGANYLALVNPTKQDLELGKIYKIIRSTPQYVLFNLNQKP